MSKNLVKHTICSVHVHHLSSSSVDGIHTWHPRIRFLHLWMKLSFIRFFSCFTKFWGNFGKKLVIYMSKMWWMTITYMDEQISSKDESVIREYHLWMEKLHSWMELSSMNAIHGWRTLIHGWHSPMKMMDMDGTIVNRLNRFWIKAASFNCASMVNQTNV